MAKFNEETTLAELLANPKAIEIMAKYNLPCLSCPYAQFEMENLKIGEICKMYNIDIKALLTELSQSEGGKGAKASLTKRAK